VSATERIVIRTAGADDVNAVLELWPWTRSQAALTPDTEQAVAAAIAHEGSVLLVAEQDHHIVGSLIVGWDGRRGNMYRLAVVSHLRRQGIARRLADEAHQHLRRVGAQRVTALVAHEEEDATGLWRSVGYECDVKISRFVRNR
jgi:ribosomal protein S18 acetylase RimI-like enzyme